MKPKPNKNRVDWVKARAAYVNSVKTLGDVAREFGATDSAIEQRAHRENWTEQRKALSDQVSRDAQTRLTTSRTEELAAFNSETLLVAKALRGQIRANLIASQTAKVALTPDKLRALASTAEVVQRMGRVALGASNDTAPPQDAAEQARKVREHLVEMEKATDGSAAALVKP